MMNRGHYQTPSPLISRTSTVLFSSVAELRETNAAMASGDRSATTYGTHTTPTTYELEQLLLAGEGGAGAELSPSGLASIAVALFAMVRSGDHLLVTDSAYGPARDLCDGLLTRFGVDVEYYDPLIGADIASLIRPATTGIWMESPGTHTFEIQDVPAIVAAARAADHRIVTAIDNTWGSPGLLRPFDLGVDISAVALTKYWGGHADVLAGATFANAELLPAVRTAARQTGQCLNGEDAFLVIRGARTVDLRIRACGEAGLDIAHRLDGHARVGRVLHPALPADPGHALYERDFHGACGLFSFELLGPDGARDDAAEVDAFTDRLVARGHFGLGYSWGGYESLVMPARWSGVTRVERPWTGGQLVRLHIGLEPVDELWADLEAALAG
ncbi:MAG: cystathionine beta-lyase [Chloroflexota bacterium]